MTHSVIDVKDLEQIVLTNNGLVVGKIKIIRFNSDIDFRGQAVNYRSRVSLTDPNYDRSLDTNNGFACGISINKGNQDDLKINNYLQTQSDN